jgi:hypothetical protein
MRQDTTKDRRINIRLDEDTYFAIKKIVENDLKTDISSYCRSLLWVSTLHESTLRKIKNTFKQFNESKYIITLEYMLTIKNEIEFIEKFLTNMKENRKKYDDLIAMIEKWHATIKGEAQKYFSIYNEFIDYCEQEYREAYGAEYDTNPTISKPGKKINI